jgi:hypothetical protein
LGQLKPLTSIAVVEFHSSTPLLSIFCWRQEMIRFKTPLNFVIVFSVLFGLVFVIGCGNSKEEQAMTDFLKLYSDTVDQYAKADEATKAELKATLDSFDSKWSDMEMEMDGRLTPNDLEKFDKQYKEIQKKYTSLKEKS